MSSCNIVKLYNEQACGSRRTTGPTVARAPHLPAACTELNEDAHSGGREVP